MKAAGTKWGQIPSMMVDGEELTQTRAIVRYLGAKVSVAGTTFVRLCCARAPALLLRGQVKSRVPPYTRGSATLSISLDRSLLLASHNDA